MAEFEYFYSDVTTNSQQYVPRRVQCIYIQKLVKASGDRLSPVSTTRVHGPSSRAVNSARELGPWTRVVETGL